MLHSAPTYLWLWLCLTAICSLSLVAGHTKTLDETNVSSWNSSYSHSHSTLSRSKRVAIFDGQGVVKFVPSLAYPVKQVDKEQSFWWFFNFQCQWIPTTIPLYWWSFWNTTAFVSTAREWRKDMQTKLLHDEARAWVYDAIETGMEQLDAKNGGACLLRSICEISQRPFQNSNIFSEILNAVLVPTLDNVSDKYLHARDAGLAGADCRRTYSECSPLLWTLVTNMAKNPF
ncbi:uncharacterized protein LOC117898916 [Drosophila subobscura]|uniref:uncharacterized protein LOC117898916 n=1 Tax=Drosophila subobscura TaxID=7241 RepID=UPI00155A6991|nr:uncharacterized protein LOC117898916 [Drosophila subobscura]